jgi:hypothetical protein
LNLEFQQDFPQDCAFMKKPATFMILVLFSIIVFLSPSIACAGQSIWTGVERTVAVGDVHGDFDQFVAVLRSADLIDSNMQWSGEKTHLVQTGDIPDRGPDTRKALDLLMRLEEEARSAGGAVHALIGNHEAMNVYGDLRYVTPGEFASFRTENSEQVREVFYRRHLQELAEDPERKGESPPGEDYMKAWEEKHPLGYFEHRFYFGPKGKYGKWIRQHNTVIQINDSIFSHAGISPKYADFDFDTINERIREELKDFSKLEGGIALDPDGPLWYRDWAKEEEDRLEDTLNWILNRHDAKRMVVAHTPTDGTLIPRFSGRILLIDVGLSGFYGSRLACLVIENDRAFALHRGKHLEIPTDSGPSFLSYLKRAAALDPPTSPLLHRIQKLEEILSPIHP